MFKSPLIKIAVWCVSSLAIVGTAAVIIHIIKRLFHDYFNEINEMGRKYHAVERRFIVVSIVILAAYCTADVLALLIVGYRSNVELLLNVMYFFCVFIELWFLTQMFQLSNLKESLSAKELENMSLLLYSSDLEKNFSEIKNIKHDIKNLFFTMGQYVERSGDSEFQDFYRNEIFPFAEDEILKNDLYARLMHIENEQLRAFLYYKLTQALKFNLSVSVEVRDVPLALTCSMSFSDIVRILGILIDNAIEESLLLGREEGGLAIVIASNAEAYSIKIQNKVRPETLRDGVKQGVSRKEGDRGRGLKIANEIIRKYDFAALNSYFQNGQYVQNLIIYKLKTGTAESAAPESTLLTIL
jgi:hypothetical protein